eukprot:UN34393
MNFLRTTTMNLRAVNPRMNVIRSFSSSRENWLRIFDNFAVSRKGFLTMSEFRRMLSICEYGDGSIQKYEALFNQVDLNHDGFIKKETFGNILADVLAQDRAAKLDDILFKDGEQIQVAV